MIAEGVDDIGLPIDRAVPQVGGVERGFLVLVIGIGFPQIAEALGGSVCRNGLREERAVVHLERFEQGLDLFGGIVARRMHGLHHELRLLDDLVAGVVLQEPIGEERRDNQASAKDQSKDRAELG